MLNLGVFHCWLISQNLTTNEEMTHAYGETGSGSPFSLGWRRNCKLFWCGPPEKSLLGGFVYADARDIENASGRDVPLDAEF